MATETDMNFVSPPRLIPALSEGFNTVAGKVYLILLPVLLDVFLWLGPQFRIDRLFTPLLNDYANTISRFASPEITRQINELVALWIESLKTYNLASASQTFPIGLPSLMANRLSDSTPLGQPAVLEISSFSAAFGLWLLFIVIGFLMGCLFLNTLARSSGETTVKFDFKVFVVQSALCAIFILTILLAVFLISLPASAIISLLAMINASLGSIALLAVLFLMIWLFIPLIFTPHSIFLGQRNLLVSALTSIRLVRNHLTGSSLFLVAAILIAQGMDILWKIPPATSWLTLVGILGHAFIYTSLLTASFIYFRSGVRWLMALIKQQSAGMVQA
ncbi:MAG: hypothetical protein KatS3mg045_1014 [Bellilinea sp.]|nr:MAG: hypothetical protein KatS3mg045_1014 [Bellilinea sp.]